MTAASKYASWTDQQLGRHARNVMWSLGRYREGRREPGVGQMIAELETELAELKAELEKR